MRRYSNNPSTPGLMRRRQQIHIRSNPLAHIRRSERPTVTKARLLARSRQHIRDVRRALQFFSCEIHAAILAHDADKVSDIDGFHADYLTGLEQTEWRQRHRTLNRHHLMDAGGVPDDVNLVDVLDFIADCVTSGMASGGTVHPLHLPPDVLERAFQNTLELLKGAVVVTERTKARPKKRR
jgi:hypothetical protein